MFGVGKFVVDHFNKNLKVNIPSPLYGRGKHELRSNKINEHILFQINTHIQSIPKFISHYSMQDNNEKRYLSPVLGLDN